MSNYDILKSYYKEVCAPLIFVGERIEGDENNIRVYLYDFSKEIEIENFKKVFQEYMLMYVKNYETIEYLDLTGEISSKLVESFKSIYLIETPNRDPLNNGIYGELFNDFYLRNVLNKKSMIAYVNKKAYSNNSEIKGIDLVCCNDLEDKMEIVLSEAKFVGTLSRAKTSLISDISGIDNHLNKEYINSYMNFVLDRQPGAESELKESLSKKIRKINQMKYMHNQEFIDIINELDFTIKFVYFAVFKQEKSRNINRFIDAANEIIDKFKSQIMNIGINNYSMDIVFVPTFNTATVLKYKMEETDE